MKFSFALYAKQVVENDEKTTFHVVLPVSIDTPTLAESAHFLIQRLNEK